MAYQDNQSKQRKPGKWSRPKRKIDEKVKKAIAEVEASMVDSQDPVTLRGLSRFQRNDVERYFSKSQEYAVKIYRDGEEIVCKVFPVGRLKRLTEQKTQEVLMNGRPEALPPMGAFERFIVHDYLKEREGVKTESYGEGQERYVEIQPLFGRSPKKAKRKRLTR